MGTVSFLILMLAASVQSLACPTGQQPCGSSGCYDPTMQGCNSSSGTIQCINSCNGICYSNSQYCYNNTKICNNGESVCDVKQNSPYLWSPPGLTCYNPSELTCSNDILCSPSYGCGAQCLNDYNMSCAIDNQTICYGFYLWQYYYGTASLELCGPQQQCYDNTASVCLNETTVCQGLNAQLCGTDCFNPDSQTCIDGTIQCINSCNGTCYSNSQYCYNNTQICNNGESVCDVKQYSFSTGFPPGLTCYNPSQYICSKDILCSPPYTCGAQCLTEYPYLVCAIDNQTICHGFYFWNYYNTNRYLGVCGPQQQCYDNTASVCLNETTVCEGLNAQLCGTDCFNADLQTCVDGTIQCINSCNGACYSTSQYCYNNTKLCGIGESVCDVKQYSFSTGFSPGLTCYDPSQFLCYNDTLCYPQYTCGAQCLNDSNSVCAADNQTICYGFYFWQYSYAPASLQLCGPQQQCYDNTISICIGNNDTVCPIGSQLCSGVCYDPQTQYCTGGDNSIYCLNNPSAVNCLLTSTVGTDLTSGPTTPTTTIAAVGGCCPVQNCTTNSDCCQPDLSECQCYRHTQADTYGSCVNPYIKPVCGDSCPIQGRCRSDSDCCKCQCADVTFADSDGNSVTTKQCIRR